MINKTYSIEKKAKKELSTNRDIINKDNKINREENEQEYECVNSPLRNNNYYEYSYLSFKSSEDQNNVPNINNKENKGPINVNLCNPKSTFYRNANKYNNQYICNFTEKLYNSEEHLDKKKKFKKRNKSQLNLINLNKLVLSNKNNKDTYLTKYMKTQKDIKKNLFHEDTNGNIEEKVLSNTNLKAKKTLVSKDTKYTKGKSCYDDNKSKNRIKNFESFFKLKPKSKKPLKSLYMDNIIYNNTLTKFNTLKNREQNTKGLQSNKKNNIFSSKKIGIKKEEEIPVNTIIITTKLGEDKNIKIDLKEENKCEEENNNIVVHKKYKMRPKKFLCCLNSNCLC